MKPTPRNAKWKPVKTILRRIKEQHAAEGRLLRRMGLLSPAKRAKGTLVPWTISVSDGFCEWAFPIMIRDTACIRVVWKRIAKTFRQPHTQGELRTQFGITPREAYPSPKPTARKK